MTNYSAPAKDTAKAKRDTPMAIHDRIVGPLLRLLSISNRQSQLPAVPEAHPAASCPNCSSVIFLNALGYPTSEDTVGEDMLATYEKEAAAYRAAMSHNELLPEAILRRDLTPAAYLAIFAVPDLVAEVRRLRKGGAL